MKTISIQGYLSSYSHIAAESIFNKDIELLQRDTFTEVFDDLKEGRAEKIVIPIENSTYGSIYQNYDNLTKYDFHIINEVYLIVNFHLIAHPDAKFEDISDLHTHPVALGQIRGFLEANPQIKSHEFPDTGGGVKMVKEKGLKNAVGAASRLASEIYGMKVLKEKIQDNKKNYTRFFVLGRRDSPIAYSSSGADKTTIEFELGQESGTLFKALGTFANRDIALTKIESRPIMHTDWEYIFYIDVMAGINGKKMKEALKELKDNVKDLRILGSYKKGVYIDT